jgi:hypothetical protein
MEVKWDVLNLKTKPWEIVDIKGWMNVLPSICALKCNRFSDGSVMKLKARLCARGDKHI